MNLLEHLRSCDQSKVCPGLKRMMSPEGHNEEGDSLLLAHTPPHCVLAVPMES